jgi:hypothetical protein
VTWGLVLVLDYRGSANWWVRNANRQGWTSERFWRTRHTKRTARHYGLFSLALGLLLIALGIWS